jgi:glycosyltransferase involved in cell wall biosynthesis
MTMLEINFTVWDTSISGGIRAIFEVAKRLASRGYGVQITALMGDDRWFPMDVPITYVDLSTLFRLAKSYTNFRQNRVMNYGDFKALEKRFVALGINFGVDFINPLIENTPDCDINIATWYKTSMPVWFSGKGKPYFFMQDFHEQIKDVSERRIFESALKLPFFFLANSNFTKQLILDLQPNAKLCVANVGVDTKIFYPREKNIAPDLKRKKVMVLIRGEYFKGDDIGVKVLKNVNKKIPIHALVVGSSQNLEKVRESVGIDFPYTLYEGVTDNQLASLYSSADLLLFTSRTEGFALPPLEAMACGTAVVTTNCKGNLDYSIHEYNCLMALPSEIQNLVDYTIKVISDDLFRCRLVKAGMETAKKFSWDNTVDDFEIAFKSAEFT